MGYYLDIFMDLINQYTVIANLFVSGVGVLLSGCISLWIAKVKIKKQFNSDIDKIHIKIDKQSAANITEEILRKDLERNNQLLCTVLNHHSGFRETFYEKQLYALDILWKAIVELEDTIPESLRLYLLVLKKDEFNYTCISKSKMFELLRTQIGNLESHSNAISKISTPVTLLRYAIDKDLYNLWRVYLAVTDRITVLFSRGLDLKSISPWQDDEGINQQLRTVFSISEIEDINSRLVGGFDFTIRLLQEKAIKIIYNVTTGKNESRIILDNINIISEEVEIKSKDVAKTYSKDLVRNC